MANLKEVRTRIASVSSTQQITSAMKMVSAAKFRRAQNAILGMRPYAAQLGEIVSDIGANEEVMTPYHETRPLSNVLIVVVVSNKGLCGAFNSNVLKEATNRMEYFSAQHPAAKVQMITIGKRATEFFSKRGDFVVGSYDELLDTPDFDAIANLAESLMAQFCEKRYDHIELVYNQFKNSLTQILTTEKFLPVASNQDGGNGAIDWAVELLYVAKEVIVIYRKDQLTAHESQIEILKKNNVQILLESDHSRVRLPARRRVGLDDGLVAIRSDP